MSERRDIAGFPVLNTTAESITKLLHDRLNSRTPTVVVFANANLITQCGHLRAEIAESDDVVVLNDGIALDAASVLRFGSRFRENLNGTDFTPALLRSLDRPARVFLLGSEPATVERAADILGKIDNVAICGWLDGFSIWDDEAATVARIRDVQPDILLVAMGNPRQENWIFRHRASLGVPLIMGVGALFEFVAGTKPRAPRIMRSLRLEWLHRMALEPRRLAGRYTIGIAHFFATVLLYKEERGIR